MEESNLPHQVELLPEEDSDLLGLFPARSPSAASREGLIEYYRQHKAEIDLLSNDEALFTLFLIRQLGPESVGELADHPGKTTGALEGTLTLLRQAGMIELPPVWEPESEIKLTDSGASLLESAFPSHRI